MSGAAARAAQAKRVGARVVSAEEFEQAEALLRAYSRLKRGAAAGANRLDVILATPKGTSGMPRGQGRHGDPTASRAGKMLWQQEQARMCRVIAGALCALSDDQRDTVQAYYIERSATTPQLAKAAGVSVTAVCKRRDRAVLALMDAVREEFGRVISPAG